MDMFGGLTKTSSRIAIASALGMTLGGFAMGASPAKAADLGGDCCADLEERVAELEATTVRKGNKKVSVTISGWIVDLGSFWNDGHTSGLYWGSKDTTLSSHFNISGSATIAPGWTAGYTAWIEMPGSVSTGFANNQFNDNACGGFLSGNCINVLDSYMWIKSDKWGTVNWGKLTQATNNLALLPDLSGTIIESNAVLFDGGGMFIRPKRTTNSNDMLAGDLKWASVTNCISGGGGLGADCPTGLDGNGVRFDSPTWFGFSASGGEYENTEWDVAVKYAADWGNFKVSAAYGFAENTDEGCHAGGSSSTGLTCGGGAEAGGGGAPFQNFKKDVTSNQVGASIMHVPSGLFVYGLWENENNQGTPFQTFNTTTFGTSNSSNANDTTAWYIKGGIKRTWTPLGATVLYGEYAQYQNMFAGACASEQSLNSGFDSNGTAQGAGGCFTDINTGVGENGVGNQQLVQINSSTVNRWGLGIVQEIDAAAMHVFARWQHLDLNMNVTCLGTGATFEQSCVTGKNNTVAFGQKFNTSTDGLDIFQIGGVIFF
jgi:hypothetical protein